MAVNPIHILTSNLFNLHFSIILQNIYRLPEDLFSLDFPNIL